MANKNYPRLGNSLTADVVIIGGGITGLVSAYLLSENGKKVIILEKDTIGSGATQYTTAFLTQVIDTSYSDLITIMGKSKAKLVASSHRSAIDLIESIVKKEKIDCGFKRCSNFLYANSPQEADELSEENKAMKKAGLHAGFNVSRGDLGFINFGYIEIKNQAKFTAKKFIASLAEILNKRGVMIFEKSKAKKIESDGNAVQITSGRYTITADVGIVATYEPFNRPLSLYFKKGFYTTYVISAKIPKGIIKEAIYEDAQNPYHYFRIDPDKTNDILTIGGEDHRSALKFNKGKMFKNLETYTKTILPEVHYKITEKWTGPILEPADGLPSIGSLRKDNILYAMAFSGNGMTYSAISAQIFADTIINKKNAWAKLYSANRVPTLKSLAIKGKDYSEELFHGIIKSVGSHKK